MYFRMFGTNNKALFINLPGLCNAMEKRKEMLLKKNPFCFNIYVFKPISKSVKVDII